MSLSSDLGELKDIELAPGTIRYRERDGPMEIWKS